ncbi:hypothetical protein GCM10029992_35170 [Glycomyces albus]
MAAMLKGLGRAGMDRHALLLAAAAAWSSLALAVGALWTADVMASPFGANDPRTGEVGSYLEGLEPEHTGVVAAAMGLAGLLTAAAMWRAPGRLWPAVPAVALGVLLLVVVPDVRVIQNFAYLFFGYTGLWEGALGAQVVAMAGGFLWMVAAATQPGGGTAWFIARGEPRWARAATYTAAALALPYAVVRVSWALGIPLGTSGEGIDEWSVPIRLGLALVFGGLPTIGAVLTIGLVKRWGERFPRWIPWLRGRRVPIWFAVVPGLVAATMIVQLGLRLTPLTVRDIVTAEYDWGEWGASLPGLFILPWGIALAAAVYGYTVRRLHGEAADVPPGGSRFPPRRERKRPGRAEAEKRHRPSRPGGHETGRLAWPHAQHPSRRSAPSSSPPGPRSPPGRSR